MNPKRPRRSGLLCCHFTRNLAYYRAGWVNGKRIFPRAELWATINSNFLDIAALEWCKVFADNRARHSWRKIVVEPTAFLPQLLGDLDIQPGVWEAFIEEMRAYRDKFVAHLDDDPTMHVPVMDFAESSIHYFYETIRSEQDRASFDDLPRSLRDYARDCEESATELYRVAKQGDESNVLTR